MHRLLALAAFCVPLQASAFIGLFWDNYTIPVERKAWVAVTLYPTFGAFAPCFARSSPEQQLFYVLALAPPIACAEYFKEPECNVFVPPNVSDTLLGHELTHCFDDHTHNMWGIPE